MNFDKTAFLRRAFEEIDRVIEASGGELSARKISRGIGRHVQFLTQLRGRPDTYTLTIEDLVNLSSAYNIDDVYILKGIRYQSIQDQSKYLKKEYEQDNEKYEALKGKYETLKNKITELKPLIDALDES